MDKIKCYLFVLGSLAFENKYLYEGPRISGHKEKNTHVDSLPLLINVKVLQFNIVNKLQVLLNCDMGLLPSIIILNVAFDLQFKKKSSYDRIHAISLHSFPSTPFHYRQGTLLRTHKNELGLWGRTTRKGKANNARKISEGEHVRLQELSFGIGKKGARRKS